ncbi:RNA-directed DNA polymerase, eukaryota, reverse transcriptase zinc-binding domain protein [Tanacetum coccineum]
MSDQTILCIIENIGSHIVSFVSFVYAANGNIERRNLWADLNRHKQITNGKPWVMGGDMNVILNTNEHSTRVSFKAREGNDTWVLKKLDKVMVNEEFIKKFDKAHVIFNPYLVSDHSQAAVVIPNGMKKKKKAFKQNGNLFDKVKEIRNELKNIQKKIDEDPYNKALRDVEVVILKDYVTTMEDKEKLLFQKSKIKWLSLGDNNNSFFHKTLKGRYQRNIIERIQDANGNNFEGQDVAYQFVMHFQKFLGQSCDVKDINDYSSLFYNKISDYEALSMVNDVSTKEIKDALFDISDNKAPGLMDIPLCFLKRLGRLLVMIFELLKGYDRKGGPSRAAFKIDIQKAYDVTPSNLSMQRNVEYPKALHYWVNSTRSENDY